MIGGQFASIVRDFLIVDCRYPYEYSGGHIKVTLDLRGDAFEIIHGAVMLADLPVLTGGGEPLHRDTDQVGFPSGLLLRPDGVSKCQGGETQ